MAATEKQTQANRRNASRSTGPRTSSGKHSSRRNALKHGTFAHDLLIDPETSGESREEFDALLCRLHDEHAPQGFLEELLVSQIATQYWRLRRLFRSESGEIAKTLTERVLQLAAERSRSVQCSIDMLRLIDNDQDRYQRPIARAERERLTGTSHGLRHILSLLASVRLQLEATGSLGGSLQRGLAAVLGSQHEITHRCQSLSTAATQPGQNSPPDHEASLHDLLAHIDQEIATLEESLEATKHREALEVEHLQASLSLPRTDAADKLLRYERTIQNQLSRSIAELQRLQNQRRASS